MSKKRISSLDVVCRAGVSQSAVSRVFSRVGTAPTVSDEMRARVMEAASDLGYRPNAPRSRGVCRPLADCGGTFQLTR
ncbi:LacI family DNA-binding transcriptional regulator [Ensifer sp. ENS09]|nr:LacI family DNA-binding transcriptional regulator [Ensifer sp. ENS09]